jgi:hypothetical protein
MIIEPSAILSIAMNYIALFLAIFFIALVAVAIIIIRALSKVGAQEDAFDRSMDRIFFILLLLAVIVLGAFVLYVLVI